MKTKLIEYAYPTSETATKNGYRKTGCWFVSIYPDNAAWQREKVLKYFKSKQAAHSFAETLPEPYHHWIKYFSIQSGIKL